MPIISISVNDKLLENVDYMIKELVKVNSVGEFIRKSKAGIKMLVN